MSQVGDCCLVSRAAFILHRCDQRVVAFVANAIWYCLGPPQPLAFPVIQCQVMCDPEQPGLEQFRIAEGAELLPHPQECFLSEIFCRGAIASEHEEPAAYAVPVTVDDGVERTQIPRTGMLHQLD